MERISIRKHVAVHVFNKAPSHAFAHFALPVELQPHELGLTRVELATEVITCCTCLLAACRNRTYRLLITNQVHNQPAQAANNKTRTALAWQS